MIATSTIMLGLSAAGLALSVKGNIDQADAQKDASDASKRAEDARKKQAALQYAREQRKIFRDAQAANAIGLSNITNAQAQFGSGLPGLYGQTSGALNQQSFDLAQNAGIGNEIFSANADVAMAQGRAATAQGWSSLGKDIYSSAGKIAQVGSTIWGGPKQDVGLYNWNPIANVNQKA
jgi:hypothetical protein